MIISVEEAKKYIKTDLDDSVLGDHLQALEIMIRERTNNRFLDTEYRKTADIVGGLFHVEALTPFKVGDTVQISGKGLNQGLYTVKEVEDSTFTVNEDVADAKNVLVTKIVYPMDVKMGVVNILKWRLRNEAANSGDTSKREIRSETISRYSVTYATDATESDIDEWFGVPRKYIAFLKHYKKARF